MGEFTDAYRAERDKQKASGQYQGWDLAGFALLFLLGLFVFFLVVL